MAPRTDVIDISSFYLKDPSGCWLGIRVQKNGYCKIWIGTNHYWLHRYMYERYKGKIPSDMELDHICRNRNCCNPDHLEVVNSSENAVRGECCKFSRDVIDAAIADIKAGHTQVRTARKYKMSRWHLRNIMAGDKRNHGV
jgi:hypothetical protein